MYDVYMVNCPEEGMMQFETLREVAQYLKISQRMALTVLGTGEVVNGATIEQSGCGLA